ncbi:MAG: hypothetical protein ABIJ57_00975 [Pseudomonadota bacterium]
MDINYPLKYWKDFNGPFPQMVFADNARGLFSTAVKIKTKGFYGHFCWLIGRNEIASQWFYFQRQTLDHYEGAYLKFVHNPAWTDLDRIKMLAAINADLDLCPWKTRYDVIGVIGELFGIKWLNRKRFDFCSERGKYLAEVDPAYDLKHPTPKDLNMWTKKDGRFEVTGRFAPG